MYYLLLIVSIFLTSLKSTVYSTYAKKEAPSTNKVFKFNAISYATAAVITLIVFLLGEISLSLTTILCALIYAIIVFSLQTLSIVALKFGPMSLTSLFVLYGMIIPSIAGPIFWNEPFGILQIVGIVAIILSLWFLRDSSTNDNKLTKTWIILAVLCFLLSGFAGLAEKIHQSTPTKDERNGFILFACFTMFLFSLAGIIATNKDKSVVRSPKRLYLLSSISGVIVGAYSSINLILAGALDSMIYYPIANGGALLLTVLISIFIFKEKPSSRKIVGFIIGLISIILLSLPTII